MAVRLQADLRWLLLKARKRVIHGLCGRLFRDDSGDPSRAVLIAGTARSGTTWLADIIASQVSSRMMFEPFHSGEVRSFGGFPRFPYRRPTVPDALLTGYARAVLDGTIRDPWLDRHIERLFPTHRLIKEIRGNLFLAWLKNWFPKLPPAVDGNSA